MKANPARRPSFIRPASIFTSITPASSQIFCVRVLRAVPRAAAGRDLMRSHPRRAVRDHASGTGLWFHCQMGDRVLPSKSSLVCG
jgi:hypothetical protein